MLQMKIIPSTEKCFLDESIADKPALSHISMLQNERMSFQVVMTDDDPNVTAHSFDLQIDSPLCDRLSIFRVEQVPVKLPIYHGNSDPNYLRKTPGLYPDLLLPLHAAPKCWFCGCELHSLFISLFDLNGIAPGKYAIRIYAEREHTVLCEATLCVEVIGAMLPKSDLIYTCWFHSDCLAQYYRVPVFSEEYWRIVRNFVVAAVNDGQNMLLTPVFTPPLDTGIGHERLTVQLVDVTVTLEGEYRFGFEQFDRFIRLSLEEGIEFFEISHLFTQWGCAHAPKIMANTPEGYRRIWGWETDANGTAYQSFLRAFLKAFLAHAQSLGIEKRLWFHISDEPSVEHLDAYLSAKNSIADILEGYPIIDALSGFDFYQTKAVHTPIPAIDHMEPFVQAGVPNLWTYYCCGQNNEVSNRLLAMPGYRTRILGVQLFKYRIVGFLQWGFNFYNCAGSYYPVDPYVDTSADYFVPAGDAFVVYPAPDGTAYPTLHGQQFFEALQDLRALRLCAEKIGFQQTLDLIEANAITFKSYPQNQAYILEYREKINRAIAAAIK